LRFTTEIDPAHLRINAAWRRGKTRDGRPTTYLSAKYKKARDCVLTSAVESAAGWRFMGGVSVSLRIVLRKVARTGAAAGMPWGDVDGPVKGVLDALQGYDDNPGILVDDAQVMEIYAIKGYDPERPRVEVEVVPYESDH